MESSEINRATQMESVQQEAFKLFKSKNADYGDAFAQYGTVGILVRLGDKIARLQSVTKTGINLVKTETLRDTLLDLHNYAAMGIMLLDEKDDNTTYVQRSNFDEDKVVNSIMNGEVVKLE